MNSRIYTGHVIHRRLKPVGHEFKYPLCMLYLDLGELDRVFKGRWFWSAERWAPVRFLRSDHLGDPEIPLDCAVRDLVAEKSGRRPAGPIRLLTQLRYFGYCMNPVSFYYCFDEEGGSVEAIVLEVHNTPWGELHAYVLPVLDDGSGFARADFPKEMHVSPFMGMEMRYGCRFSAPGGRLSVHMKNMERGDKIFDAALTLERREITGASLAITLLRFPFMTQQVVMRIYWQALRLWLKRVPYIPHPERGETT